MSGVSLAASDGKRQGTGQPLACSVLSQDTFFRSPTGGAPRDSKSAFTRVHSPPKTGVNALNDALCVAGILLQGPNARPCRTVARRESLLYSRPGEARGEWLFRTQHRRSAGATWRSGYATVCKTVYPGSIPGVASKEINYLARGVEAEKCLGSFSVA